LEFLFIVIRGAVLDLFFEEGNALLDRGFFSPAPSTSVVSSFLTTAFFTRPSMSIVTLSSLMPSSSLMNCPPVRIAMSSRTALLLSPKPGALTAQTLRPARRLVDDESCERFAFDIFSDDQERFARLCNGLQDREEFFHSEEIFLS
jgi:hypothetical protein